MIRKAILILLCALLVLYPLATALAETPTPVPPSPSAEPTTEPTLESTATPTPEPTPEPTPDPALAPIITLTGDDSLTVDAAFTFTDPGATARDYLGADLTDRITVEGAVVPYLVGKYTLTYAVTDSSGNSAQVQRTVTVVPVQLPEVVQPPEKTIYLTFDDGPGLHTATLLDILKKHGVKATFFVVGERPRKDLIKRAYQEGHSIGVHTYTHNYKKIYASEKAFFADFLATEEVIYEQTGQYTTIFRFPGGSGNSVSYHNRGIMTRLAKIMEDMGYRYFDWNVSASDAKEGHKDWKASRYNGILMGNLKKDGSPTVILQHDLNVESIRALEYFIPWALEKGYTFLPLDMTSPVIHSEIKN